MSLDMFIGGFYGILIGATVSKIIYAWCYRNYVPKGQSLLEKGKE